MKVPESDARCVARSQWTGLEGAVTVLVYRRMDWPVGAVIVIVYPMDWSGVCSDCYSVLNGLARGYSDCPSAPNGLAWMVQ